MKSFRGAVFIPLCSPLSFLRCICIPTMQRASLTVLYCKKQEVSHLVYNTTPHCSGIPTVYTRSHAAHTAACTHVSLITTRTSLLCAVNAWFSSFDHILQFFFMSFELWKISFTPPPPPSIWHTRTVVCSYCLTLLYFLTFCVFCCLCCCCKMNCFLPLRLKLYNDC